MRPALLGAAALAGLAVATPLRRHDGDDDEIDMGGMQDDSSVSMGMPDLVSSSAVASSSAASVAPAPSHAAHAHATAAVAAAAGGHHHSGPVLSVLNETRVHAGHAFPPSYLAADFRLTNDSVIFGEVLPADWDADAVASHPGLKLAGTAAFVAAYFGVLPIALALRAAGHPSHYLVNGAFVALAVLAWLLNAVYKAAMPNMYEGAAHDGVQSLLLLVSLALAALDSLGLARRALAFRRAGARDWRDFFRDALAETRAGHADRYEMVGLIDDHDEHERVRDTHGTGVVVFTLGDDDDDDAHNVPARPTMPRRDSPAGSSRHSTGSEGTLRDSPHVAAFKGVAGAGAFDAVPPIPEEDDAGALLAHAAADDRDDDDVYAVPTAKGYRRAGEVVVTWVRRTQVVVAYAVLLLGITEYTGMCRGGYINTCAAHLIKGSIFFGYGVLTFARYLGAYADLGWAWNRRPAAGARAVSAEMVECAVIFAYGATNTWMERFGSRAGDPYTVKQVQHISIAVMFWFAGATGVLLESTRIRRALAAVFAARAPQPPTYAASFNPFPALVIAVTGLAMAAHHQDYEFQVSIHALWGTLLAGGSACRLLTYAFLWLRPPADSPLPSRPPTEVLAAFGWATGGIVFMLSDEEVTFAAMRTGFDDVMAALNFTVATTCLVFCWVVVVLGTKGYAVLRLTRAQGVSV
ncbi:hypothetical protein Q5752_003209 [Cryptotrichosporon argae]